MEIYELRYFLGVARRQNVHRAAEDLRISPASLSKAVQRLEDELGVTLFSREGRGIRLTDHGRALMRRAAEILQLEEATRLELQPGKSTLHVVLAGAEVILLRMGLTVAETVKKRHPLATFEFQSVTEAAALAKVRDGEAHLALVAGAVPKALTAKTVERASFVTCAGGSHPLVARARGGKVISVKDVLTHVFVCPSQPLFGQVNEHQSPDGWRDDAFPRQVGYLAASLRMLEELVIQGKALAYLPDYHVETLKVTRLKISGCPYVCEQDIKLVARDPSRFGWLDRLF